MARLTFCTGGKLLVRSHPVLFPDDLQSRWPEKKQTFVARFGPRSAEGRIACPTKRIMNVNAPPVDGHPTAVPQYELDTMALVTDDHDGAIAAPNVPVRFILKPCSEAAPLKLENVIIHTIKD